MAPPGLTLRPVVLTNFTVAGTVPGFDRVTFRAALLAAYPDVLDVAIVSVLPASVLVSVELVMEDAQAAGALRSTLMNASLAELSAAFGTDVQGVDIPTVTTQYVDAALGAGDDGGDGLTILGLPLMVFIAAAGGAGAVLLLLLACCIRRRCKKDESQTSLVGREYKPNFHEREQGHAIYSDKAKEFMSTKI